MFGLFFIGFVNQSNAITTVRVANGLSNPLLVTHAPGDTSRIFIVEQRNGSTGRIRILRNGVLLARPFLSVSPVATGSEQGLLGMAFRPDYADSGYFYICYTRGSDGASVVARYRVSSTDPDSADAASAQIILFYPQPYSNHNGGNLAFGPDGYLYFGLGDGGSGNDPGNRAQNDTLLYGKLLRLDVMVDSGYAIPPDNPFVGPDGVRDEIWAKGLRNPWRWSFDRETGDLYIADVGQNAWEEIDFQPATSTGGENYGWRCMEANHCTGLSGCTCNDPALTDPISEYSHAGGRCSITGGFVYRGCAIPELQGTYFFADYCSSNIWSFRYDGVSMTDSSDRTAELAPGGGLSINSISSFGEDAFGELYICDLGGEVFKIVPDSVTDCNHNGIADACDIAMGYSMDSDSNGVPDECQCIAGEVTDLTCIALGDDIEIRWTATGTGTETYNVYRSATPEDYPNGNWITLETGIPSVSGPSAMSYTDSGAVIANGSLFYVVTAVCP